MRAPIAETVHAIIHDGLSQRDRLEAGEPLDYDQELASLKQRFAALNAPLPAQEAATEFGFDLAEQGHRGNLHQLTLESIRYALACWLDDFFLQYSTWGPRWRARTLESELYGSNAGSAKFWEEARYAETRGDLDALEVMHLCVMLGFRGDWRGQPAQLEAWVTRISQLLDQAQPNWTMPASLEPPARELTPLDDTATRRLAFSFLLTGALTIPWMLVIWWRLSIA